KKGGNPAISDVRGGYMGNNDKFSSPLSLSNEQMLKLMSLLNDKSSSAANANMAGVNQHMKNDTKNMFNLVDVSGLKLTVGHPNRTLAKITHDLRKGKVLGTGSEFTGLHLFDAKFNVSATAVNSEYFSCYVSKDVWNNRESFPLNENKSTILGQLIHLDVWGPYKVVSREGFRLNFFDNFKSKSSSKTPNESPNDDVEGTSLGHDEHQTTTPIGENTQSEGNFLNIMSTVKYGLRKLVNHSMLSFENFVSNLNKSYEPFSFEEASKDINWINAMNNEMQALYENGTYELVDLPIGRKTIKSKWVYRIKYMSSGEIERYKARLVAKGFNQREGIDYKETFNLVVKMSTVRCLIDLAVQNDSKSFQMDVNNTFLYGSLSEDAYMLPPPGFFDKNDKRVCKLKKSLYGLKLAPRQWNHKLYKTLIEAGFEQSKNDHSLYIKNDGNMSLYILVNVDDLVITGNSKTENFKSFLNKKFKIKDLGELKYFLGIEVLKTKNRLCLNQIKYCLELLHEFGLLACRPVVTPLPENIVLSHKETDDDKFLRNIM
nr:ribonuclease H-like domain-containing protein [Tanacetum cinerariifolium]